jgi:hypothetical protein
MQTYSELVELARLCLKQSYFTANPILRAELGRLAKEYQESAGKLDDGKLPDIGEE